MRDLPARGHPGHSWATRLGMCPVRALRPARRDRSLACLQGQQGQCRGVWERPARKLLGVCLSCESLPGLSHPAPCSAGPRSLLPCRGVTAGPAARPGQGTRPFLEGQQTIWFAFGFGFSVHQKPSCKKGQTAEILHLAERAN